MKVRWLVAVLVVVFLAGAVSAAEGPSVKKMVVNLPFEEAELILTSEAQRQNLNLVNVLDIRKGMENRGDTFRKFKIYQFCNLELGIQIYADSPDYGAFQLCSILIYEVDPSRTALVSSRQSWIIQALPEHRPGPDAVAAARQFERIIDEIFGAVAEEAKRK
ncbi:MAG: DUF302 domain-containing protein [Candidatus Rokubacteria bacterium]|nr:DUF302 domain-containing protein [Candidatus Rokubacteria bacterium]MBI2555176.1 DUF302 domain-containing protein [Candidatus Rokubacteria bacterium]